MSDDPEWEKANQQDAVTYWRIGRALCPDCQTVKAYVAAVDVEDLRCSCGSRCLPACGDEAR